MGIQNRDYFRDSGTYRQSSGGDAWACKWLIGITVVVFLLQSLITRSGVPADFNLPPGVAELPQEALRLNLPRVSVVEQWFRLDPQQVIHGQVWRLVTYAFCHDRYGIWHIVFNMLFLWWFGVTLERMYGSREFLLFYLSGALVSGAVFVLLGLLLDDLTPAVGASGAVMAVVMLYAIHYPRERIYLFFGLFPVEIRWLVAFFIIVDLHPILLNLGGDRFDDGVAHSAHLGGLLFGWLYYRNQWRLDRLTSGFQMPKVQRRTRAQREIRIYREPEAADPASLDVKVDAILAKIHEQGEASLTDQERELLKQASQRYKHRT